MAQVRFFEDPEFLRIQTALFFFAALCAVVMFFAPLLELTAKTPLGQQTPVSMLYGAKLTITVFNYTPAEYYILPGYISLSGLGALVAAFLYRNRKRQLVFARVMIAVYLLNIGVVYAVGAAVSSELSKGLAISGRVPGWGLALVLIGALALIMAQRSIARDIKRVRSMERFW